MTQQIKYKKCYIVRHAERYDFTYPFSWLINCIFFKKDHDTPITEQGSIDAYNFGLYMYIHNFVPDVIFCSPYLRCKQTALSIQKSLKENTGNDIEIIIDPLIRETKYEDVELDELNERIKMIYNKLINSGKYKYPLLVTHASIVYCLANIYENFKVTNYFKHMFQLRNMNYLGRCVLNKGKSYKYF